jgi:hypothetical protein
MEPRKYVAASLFFYVNISNNEKVLDFLIGHGIVFVENSSFSIHCTLITPWPLF